MKYELFFSEQAKKDLERLPPATISRISHIFTLIVQNPFIGKTLKGEFHGLRSYRTGDYRIIYEILQKKVIVIILKIGHRKDVYR